MFFKLDADTAARKDLRASDKIILAIIQNYENQGEAWPGRRKLQEKSGLAAGTVCSSINRLESAGLLEVNRTGRGKSNTYKTGTKMRPVQKSDWSKNCTGSGLKNRPVQKSDWSKNCTGSGLKMRPVQKPDWSKNCTGSGQKNR
ncbi:helix-turn-helix domain-containing protein, partial [Sedimentisphaera salicampi]|uniref:helix-turn-helix domain-containing protein n=1 Tax=Sedimentisphaera salicampi TaxID=1941349 RepID=UPI001875C286